MSLNSVIFIISLLSLIVSIITVWVVYIKIKGVYINLWNMSRGLDTLFENDKKIIELTKIKGFIELTHEEEQVVRKEIDGERHKITGNKKIENPVRPPEFDPDNQTA